MLAIIDPASIAVPEVASLLQIGEGRHLVSLVVKRPRSLEVRVGVVGFEIQEAVPVSEHLVPSAPLAEHPIKGLIRLKVVRIQSDGLLKIALRLVKLSLLDVCSSAPVERLVSFRIY